LQRKLRRNNNMEIAYESSKWKKEDVEKYTIYKKKLKFGEFKFVKDGKANYSAKINFSKKREDGTYKNANVKLILWDKAAEDFVDFIGGEDKDVTISTKGGSFNWRFYISNKGEETEEYSLTNPSAIYVEQFEETPF